jgi:hexosaminidase
MCRTMMNNIALTGQTVLLNPLRSAMENRFRAKHLAQIALTFLLFSLLAGYENSLSAEETTTQTNSTLLIIPQPKSVRQGTGAFVWKRSSHWQLQGPVRDERLYNSVCELLTSKSGRFVTKKQAGYSLLIGAGQKTDFPTGTNSPTWFSNPEGYRISVTPKGLLIQSSTAQGVFYGLQTLGQLMETSESRFSCPVVEIEDWPSLKFRGVHWFPSAPGVPMYLKQITNVFPMLKLNQCVMECEAARWDSHPEVAMPKSISKADLRRLVEECRNRFIEPIPLVDVPGHATWMFEHKQNLDLAEDPETPYACCMNNPKTYEFLESVMTECIDIFHPKSFHLGYDEIAWRGRFPNTNCPLCKTETMTSLITKSANKLSDWLATRGIGTMIWGDMLLARGEADNATNAESLEEARKRRAGISKKIIIADWHYWKGDRRSLDAFQQDGFHTIAATFSLQTNIFRFSQVAIAHGSDGLLQTTWDGFFPDESVIQKQTEQFAAYVLAADYAWSGRNESPDKLGYDPKEIFLKAYAGKFARPQPAASGGGSPK